MDKINNIGLSRLLTSVYDFDGFTEQEVWCRIAQKINIIIEHFNYLDKKIENEKENNKAKFDYLLGEGLTEAVAKIILEKIADGTIGNIINETLLKEINDKVNLLSTNVDLGCVLRPTTDISNPWELFSDDAHIPVGITSSTFNSDGTISLTFDKTYKKITTFNCFADEMMKMYGLEVGASTGLASAKLFLISNLIVGTSLTFKQEDQSITISKAGFIESATWETGVGVVVKFKNVPKQTPNSVQVTVSNAIDLRATCSITGNREVTIKFYKSTGELVTDITGNWACMIDANFTGLVNFNCTSIYDANILSSMALMYNVKMKQ